MSENRSVIEELAKALGGDEIDVTPLFGLIDPDVTLHEPPSLPFGGTYSGAEEFMGAFGKVFAHLDAEHIKVERVIAGSDDAVIIWNFLWRGIADATPVPIRIAEWLTFRNGKIVEVRAFYDDTAPLMKTLEAEPKAASDGSAG